MLNYYWLWLGLGDLTTHPASSERALLVVISLSLARSVSWPAPKLIKVSSVDCDASKVLVESVTFPSVLASVCFRVVCWEQFHHLRLYYHDAQYRPAPRCFHFQVPLAFSVRPHHTHSPLRPARARQRQGRQSWQPPPPPPRGTCMRHGWALNAKCCWHGTAPLPRLSEKKGGGVASWVRMWFACSGVVGRISRSCVHVLWVWVHAPGNKKLLLPGHEYIQTTDRPANLSLSLSVLGMGVGRRGVGDPPPIPCAAQAKEARTHADRPPGWLQRTTRTHAHPHPHPHRSSSGLTAGT